MAASTIQPPIAAPLWAIIITEWALDSYLNLLHAGTFTKTDYKKIIRPDVVLLRDGIPSPHPKFQQSTFWGPAKLGQRVLASGYKMKWRQVGNGKVQLRLPVTTIGGTRSSFLCFAYEKANTSVDQRMMARFKSHMNLIAQGKFVHRGSL